MKTRLKEPETQIVTMQSLMSAFLRHCAYDNMCWLMDRKAICWLMLLFCGGCGIACQVRFVGLWIVRCLRACIRRQIV